ncbi:MAG: hypothetical protein PHT54_03260 [Candidatus Nanoarchaeia archaeon]|nr:hypothetical protein [Candidatus Nanoarchaeia archaeon]
MVKKARKNSNPRPTHNKKLSFKTFAFFGILVIILVALALVFGENIAGSAVAKKEVPVNCTDTDLGTNVFEKGTVQTTLKNGTITTYTDECKNNTVKKKIVVGVLENYCKKTEYKSGWIQCQSGVCENGACTRRCSDTDATIEYPNGFNIYSKGTVTFQKQVKEDYCNNKNKKLLHEWYCDLKTDTSKQQPVKCTLGCENGVCKQPYVPPAPCAETDNGKNAELKGTLTFESKNYVDICADEYAISVPKTGKLKITYLGSSAELVSGFFMDADPAPIEIFPENKKIAQNTVWETVYNQGDKLNFFIRVYGDKWGIGVYDHYAVGQLDPYTNKPYAVVTQISDVKWRLGFEDLPGQYTRNNKKQYSDWDYNDEVVEIEIVAPEGGWTNENPESCTGTKTSTSVLEYYCENITKKCEFIECPLGCEDGACKKDEPAVCTDSDGKKNFDTIGTCTDSTGTYNDGCSGSIQTDYYCESGKCVVASKVCPLASSCSGEKCVKDTTTCDVSPYVYKNSANTYCMKLDIVGTCSDTITVGYNWCTCTGQSVTQEDITNANTGQYDGYCTQDAAQTNTAALGCANCKSGSQIFKPGEYGKEICFFVQPNCGTTQVDLMSSFSTAGLKFNTYVPNQKYTAIACAGPGEPSCA